jgi:hypothetical protein
MPLETRSPAVLRFGRKQGVRIKLQEPPFHVLTVSLHYA